MALAETQQLRMLERLRSAGQQPVTLDQLRAGGIDFPAVVIGELELSGYVIERVYEHGRQIGVRLLETEAPDLPGSVGAPDGAEFRGSNRRSETRAALSVVAGARRTSWRTWTVTPQSDYRRAARAKPRFPAFAQSAQQQRMSPVSRCPRQRATI